MYTAPIPENDLARLATLHRYGILDTPKEQVYEDVTALASFICETPYSTITLVDRDRQWFKSEVGFGANETNRADSFCACALLSPQTMIVEDTFDDPRFANNPFVLGGPKIRFYAGAPLVASNGHILGTLCVFDDKPRKLSPQQLAGLEALGRQVMALFEARILLIEKEKATSALLQSEKLAAVGRFASSMAHSINNPLESLTNLIYLSRQTAVNPDTQRWLDQADLEVRRLAAVANHTLRFHRQASGPEAITCLSLFSNVLQVHQSRLDNGNITVEKRKRANRPAEMFEGDIRQVMSNIVSNAIDAMPNGGRLLVRSREATDWRAAAEGKPDRKGLVLTFADNGHGMDAYTQQRMFEAFFTTKDIGGLGLGLWISAEIMQRHHGRISIRSTQRPGRQGTVVVLFLPIEFANAQRES